jgi:hypothetical protein
MNTTAIHPDPEYRPIQGLLYHYTSIDALLSIADQKVLRATHIGYLNDARESDLGMSLLKITVEEAHKSAVGADRDFLGFLLHWLDNQWLYAASGSIYVVCFSEVCNQLSQWRGYTPHGRGVCLGIDAAILLTCMQRMGVGWTFQNCRYTQQGHLAWVNAILTGMRREVARNPKADWKDQDSLRLIGLHLSALLQTMAIMKDLSFYEEREVRFVSPIIALDDSRIRFRAGKTSIIPYIEFELKVGTGDGEPLPSIEIWTGPSPTQQLTHAALPSLMRTSRLAKDVSSKWSQIPYREL